VVSGAKIRDRITLKSLEEKPGNRVLMSQVHTIEIEGQEKPACVAESLGMIFF
jgi:acyl dehydratase